jgi:hypothetical protein
MKPAFTRLVASATVVLTAALVTTTVCAQPLTLSGTSYSQNFDGVAEGLPDGWTVRTGATASQVGSVAPFSVAHKNWDNTAGSFANYASTTNNEGVAFVGTETTSIQTNALNRCAGVRQTGTLGDPGAAFVLRIDNTIGFGEFQIVCDFQNLSVQGRTTVWTIDYGIGNDPTAFTAIGTYTNYGTNSGVFGTTTKTLSFGSALNNQAENVWIRVAALSGSTGSGSRSTFGIDNFDLTWTNVSTELQPPQIATQPQSRTNAAGTTATFSVGVTGTAPFTFQWKKGGQDIFDGPTPHGSEIAGANTATLTLSSVRAEDAGNYSVLIGNSVGSTNSDPATLTVVTPVPVVTNVAYLRTKLDPADYSVTDTTTLYAVEGVVTTPINLTTPANALFYMQDATAGIAVFVSGGSTIRPAKGDRVRITGPLGQFNGLLQLNLEAANFTHSVEILSSGNLVPAPIPFNFSTLVNIPVMESSIEGSLLIVSNVFLQGAGSNFVSGGNYNMTNLNGLIAQLRIDTRALDVIGKPIPAFAASVKGVMGQFVSSPPFIGGYQLFLTEYADLVEGTPPPSAILGSERIGNNLVLTWANPDFKLYSATAVNGTYTEIVGATSPHSHPISGSQTYFQLRYLAP